MNRSGKHFLFFGLLLSSITNKAIAVTPIAKQTMGVGINYGGIQLDWRHAPKYMMELRFQTGQNRANGIESKSKLIGLRGYRFSSPQKKYSPYVGMQISYITARQSNSHYEASGESVGLLGGVHIKLGRHLSLFFDAGPYVVFLKEKKTHTEATDVFFVGDTALVTFF